jgi:replicative DNA helicase
MARRCLLDDLQKLQDVWSSEGEWPFHGVSSGYPLLDQRVNRFKDGLYMFAGGAGVGKTTFLVQLMFQLLYKNPTAYGMFLSLDMPYLDVVAKLMSLASGLTVDAVRAPENLSEEELEQRENGLRILQDMQHRLEVLDQSHECYDLDSLEKHMAEIREEEPDAPMFVAIDPVLSIKVREVIGLRDKSEVIVEKLKIMARQYKCGIIMSAHLDNAARKERPTLRDIENYTGLIYGADMIGLLYNDSLNEFDTPFLEWEWGTENLMVPVIEINVVKNKHHQKLGRLFYKFYNTKVRYRECVDSEVDHYNDMLGNLSHYETPAKERGKKNFIQKKVYVAPE